MPNQRDDAPPVKTTRTTVRILEGLRSLGTAGVSDVADAVDLPVSTVHDHLVTLERASYVVKRDDRYRVGARLLTLGGHVRDRMTVFEVAKPEVEKLARDTGEHANLMIEEHGRGIFLYIATGADALTLDTYAGMRTYLHTTALGKSILAHLPTDRYERILADHGLPGFTDRTITSRAALDEELERVADRGYAVDDGERIEGVRCVAAPVVDGDGAVLGAVSVSAPKSRMEDGSLGEELPRRVQHAANVAGVNATHA
jgi:DNA-binding IclR family transcriptional regulator